jgi:hypothetical protein
VPGTVVTVGITFDQRRPFKPFAAMPPDLPPLKNVSKVSKAFVSK